MEPCATRTAMLIELTKKLVIERLPGRPDTGHKGTFGHVFIVGGSLGFTGAMKLAGLGAARAGAGLVTLGVPESLMTIVGAQMLECMTFAVGESPSRSLGTNGLEAALEFAAGKDAVVLGPGCSRHPDTREFVLAFVRKCPVPLLIDADGLNNLSTDAAALNQAQAPVLVTPHPGEMARLAGTSISDVQSDRPNTARKFASDYGGTVAWTGAGTISAPPTAGRQVCPGGRSVPLRPGGSISRPSRLRRRARTIPGSRGTPPTGRRARPVRPLPSACRTLPSAIRRCSRISTASGGS